MREAEEVLGTARLLVIQKAPYLASYVYGLIPYIHEGIKTMGVSDSMVLIYNPEWVLEQGPQRMSGVLVHEIHHVLRGHSRRRGTREPRRWNIAGDMAINCHLKDEGWPLPEKGCFPDEEGLPLNKTAEEYYNLLEKNKKLQEKLEVDATICAGNCGGIAGNPQKIEETIEPGVGRTEVDKRIIQEEAAKDIQEHFGRARGTMPGCYSDLLKRVKTVSKIPWQRKLARMVRKASGRTQVGGFDFSFARPSKRSYTVGIPRPGLIDHQCEIAVVLDTSGSMGKQELAEGLRETSGILTKTNVDSLWFIQADADVACAPKRIRARDLKTVRIHGRGGTSFVPALAAVHSLKPRPDVTIYFTDGYGDAPETPPPGMEVIWCIVSTSSSRRPADWGHLVRIGDEAT